MNLQVSLVGFITVAAYILLFGFFVNFLALRYPDSTIIKSLKFCTS